MVHIIATFIMSLLVSIVVELILLSSVYLFNEKSMIWGVVAYPFVFVSIFVFMYKIYTNKDDRNVKTYTYDVGRICIDNLCNKDAEGEYFSSEIYIRKIRNKVIGQSIVLSLMIPFMVMLFLSIPSESKFISSMIFLPVAIPQVVSIFIFYKDLLKKSRDRKILLFGDRIQIFDENLDGYNFELKKLNKIKVKKNDISKEIVQIQLFESETISKNSNITIEGYHGMDILLGKLTNRLA